MKEAFPNSPNTAALIYNGPLLMPHISPESILQVQPKMSEKTAKIKKMRTLGFVDF